MPTPDLTALDPDAYNCHNCLEPLSYTGPRDNGDANQYSLLRIREAGKVNLFCSDACLHWWWDIVGLDAYRTRTVDAATVTV